MPTDETKPASGPIAEPAAAEPKKRDVVITGQFKKDMKREQKGPHRATLRADVLAAIAMLADDIPLPARMVDHPLGATGSNIGIATSSPTWSSSTENHKRLGLATHASGKAGAALGPHRLP